MKTKLQRATASPVVVSITGCAGPQTRVDPPRLLKGAADEAALR